MNSFIFLYFLPRLEVVEAVEVEVESPLPAEAAVGRIPNEVPQGQLLSSLCGQLMGLQEDRRVPPEGMSQSSLSP